MSVLAGEPHSSTNKTRPQRTPPGLQQLWTDVLNKPNVRSKHLLLQPHIRQGCDRERERRKKRERRGKHREKKVEEEMRTARNNKRVGEMEEK